MFLEVSSDLYYQDQLECFFPHRSLTRYDVMVPMVPPPRFLRTRDGKMDGFKDG